MPSERSFASAMTGEKAAREKVRSISSQVCWSAAWMTERGMASRVMGRLGTRTVCRPPLRFAEPVLGLAEGKTRGQTTSPPLDGGEEKRQARGRHFLSPGQGERCRAPEG